MQLRSIRRLLLCFIVLTLSVPSFAQGYRGTDFWLAFPQNAVVEGNKVLNTSLFIASEVRTKGTVTVGDSIIPFTVETGASIRIDLDTNIEIQSNGVTEKKAVHLVCDHDISLYAVSHRAASTDSYMAIPTEYLGTEYVIAGYTTLPNGLTGFTSQAVILATENNTIVTIKLVAPARTGQPAGRNVEFVLNKGETFQIKGSLLSGDLTGSSITSTKPVAVFTGHGCAQVPPTKRFCDMLLEEEPPANDWGKDYVLTKFSGKDYYVARVIAQEDSTKVFVNGIARGTLAKGTFLEIDSFHFDALIHASQPVLVAQYATSSEADTIKIGDPFMLLAVPSDRGLIELTTNSVTSGGFQHYLNIVVPDSGAKTLRVDGALIGTGQPPMGVTVESVRPFAPAKATILSLRVPEGRHMISCSAPVEVYSYGFGVGNEDYDSYGHACGMRLSK